MQAISKAPRDSKNREFKPGDIVTGTIDIGSFPAEPFIAQLIGILPGNKRAEVVFLKRPASARHSIFARQTRVAQVLETAIVNIDGLAIMRRASQPMNNTAKQLALAYRRPQQISWGPARSFDCRP